MKRAWILGGRIGLGLTIAALAAVCGATDFFVAPGGNGTGALANPWGLQTALNQPAAVHPGDTIWIRGGTYSGCFQFNVNGTASSRITIRAYQGERATLDAPTCSGGGGGWQNLLNGSYYTVWGLEVTSSGSDRVSTQPNSSATDIDPGIAFFGGQDPNHAILHPGIKVVNCIIHDTAEGFALNQEETGFELYGNIIIYNGWNGPDRSHGHGDYIQNNPGIRKLMKHNLIGYNGSHGFHLYGSAALADVDFFENASVGNKWLTPGADGRAALFGDPSGINVDGNLFFCRLNLSICGTSETELGYNSPSKNSTFTNNFVYTPMTFAGGAQVNLTATGNFFLKNSLTGFTQAQYPANTYGTMPTTDRVLLWANQYEPGRCDGVVMDFDGNGKADLPIGNCGLADGQAYQVRSAYNFWGPLVATGTYSALIPSVTTSLAAYTMTKPVGWPPVVTNGDYLLVVLPVTGGTPAPTPTSSPLATATASPTVTQTSTRTWTPTPTATVTRSPTWTPSPTSTPTLTASPSPTSSPSATPTPIPPTATATSTSTPTLAPSSIPPTATPSATPTPTPSSQATPAFICIPVTLTPAKP